MEEIRRLRAEEFKQTKTERGPMDLPFALLTLLILGIGIVMMFSASYASAYYTFQGNSVHFFARQSLFALIGIIAMIVISYYDYRKLNKWAIWLLLVSIVLLILVLIIGTEVKGARRWINIGEFGFQPSEIAKIAVVLCFSTMICMFKERMKTFKYGIVPFGLILMVIAVLMIPQPHFSGTILIIATGAALMFVGGVHLGWFAGIAAFGGAVGWFLMTNTAHSSSRISIWLDPFSDPQDKGFQIVQSLLAIGSGGPMGLGLGKSRQKFLYLPEQQNDYVFAIVCEELGMLGACVVLFLFMLLIIRGYWIALHARDKFGSLIVTGITTLLAIQTFLNVAVVTNLIPSTGIPLPFFSYGGTSLMIQLAEMGIVLSVSRFIPAPKSG